MTIEKADVVIIGGGIVGASVAYHLAEAGCSDVIILEREAKQGLGSTSRATGGVRAQFSTEINIRMSLHSIDFLSHFEEATGHTSGYKPYGYLFLATNERHLEYLRTNAERQRAAGLKNVELVSTADIHTLMPQLRTDDVVGGSFCQTDGLVEPINIMRGFTERARERGVNIWLGTEVTGIEVEGGRVASVRTTRGRIETRAVVNASGAWAACVARLAGVEIPVEPLRRQLIFTRPVDGLPDRMPMVIDMTDGFHFRRDEARAGEPAGLRLAWPDPSETFGFKTDFDSSFIEKVRVRAVNRVPRLEKMEVDLSRSRAGLYEMTPDHHAIIGEAPNVRGLYLANGFSGHGVMHSPATGRILSELILHGEARLLDVSSLSAERFAKGQLHEETSFL
jgi:sarcosine oxidase subunit beta